jgi:hypothetical protein
MGQFADGHAEIEHQQRHRDGEDSVAESGQPVEALAGDSRV